VKLDWGKENQKGISIKEKGKIGKEKLIEWGRKIRGRGERQGKGNQGRHFSGKWEREFPLIIRRVCCYNAYSISLKGRKEESNLERWKFPGKEGKGERKGGGEFSIRGREGGGKREDRRNSIKEEFKEKGKGRGKGGKGIRKKISENKGKENQN